MSDKDWDKLRYNGVLGLYHLSSSKHSELKTKAALSVNDDVVKSWDNKISFLLTPPTKLDVLEYQTKGFQRWQMKNVYMHVVDPSILIDYNYASIESTPLQQRYDHQNWDKDIIKLPDDEYFIAKRKYLKEREKYLSKHGILPEMSLYEIFSHKDFYKWRSRMWFNHNLKNGDKDQYATYIPHVQVDTTTPIKPVTVVKLL